MSGNHIWKTCKSSLNSHKFIHIWNANQSEKPWKTKIISLNFTVYPRYLIWKTNWNYKKIRNYLVFYLLFLWDSITPFIIYPFSCTQLEIIKGKGNKATCIYEKSFKHLSRKIDLANKIKFRQTHLKIYISLTVFLSF